MYEMHQNRKVLRQDVSQQGTYPSLQVLLPILFPPLYERLVPLSLQVYPFVHSVLSEPRF